MDSNKKYWKGLEELRQTPAFVEGNKGEFAEHIPVEDVLSEAGLSTKTPRRDFLKALGFGLGAVTLASCSRTPVHKAVPYIIKPEEITPGIPNYYASSFNGQSILVRTREGRPISVIANPATAGLNCGLDATGVASVLDLYDMSKLQDPQLDGKKTDWARLDGAVTAALNKAAAEEKQIVILSNTVNSPTMLAAIAKLRERYPTTDHVQVDPVSYTGIMEANRLCFEKPVIPTYHMRNAEVVVSVAADFLGTWLAGEEHTQGYMANRDYKSLKKGKMSRHIQFESGLSMTGTNADVRVAIKPSEEGPALISLYNAITGQSFPGGLEGNKKVETAIALAARELRNANGRALVVAGTNSIHAQVLVNVINSALDAYGPIIDLDNYSKQYQGSDIAFRKFLTDATVGRVGVVFFLNSNPIYDYCKPAELRVALDKVDFKLSFADRADETASEANAIAPNCTYLESWGDASAREGYFTIVQPTINPVFNTRQAEQSLLNWAGENVSVYDFVRKIWEEDILPGTGNTWTDVLQAGFIYKGTEVGEERWAEAGFDLGASVAAVSVLSKELAADFELKLYESVAMRDGRYANNAFLQELPDPVSKVTWDNYAALNPRDAQQLGLGEDSRVTVEANGPRRAARCPWPSATAAPRWARPATT